MSSTDSPSSTWSMSSSSSSASSTFAFDDLGARFLGDALAADFDTVAMMTSLFRADYKPLSSPEKLERV
jgi:hypothetical protein